MPDSDYVFDRGTPIEVGSDGLNDVLKHSGVGVPDGGDGDFIFEEGRALGGGNLSVALRDSSGVTIVSTSDLEDDTYRDGGIGYRVNPSSSTTTAYWDNATLGDGTVIDDFESGSLSSAYSGERSYFDVQSSVVTQGSYALRGEDSSSHRIISTSGLNAYPDPGESFTVNMRYDSNLSSMDFYFACQTESFSNRPPGYSVEITGPVGQVTDKLSINRIDQDETLNRITTIDFDASAYANEWLEAEVFWQ